MNREVYTIIKPYKSERGSRKFYFRLPFIDQQEIIRYEQKKAENENKRRIL